MSRSFPNVYSAAERANMDPNARFWVWHHGWVKLTLRPGQHLHVSTFARTDEGWTRDYHDWTLEDGVVTREYCTEGSDCDGRHSYASTTVCPIHRLAMPRDSELLAEDHFNGAPIMVPAWVEADSEQRDQFAELAGY